VQQQYKENTTTLPITNQMTFLDVERRCMSNSKGARASHVPLDAVHACPYFFITRHEIAHVLTLELQKTNTVKSQKHHLTLGLNFFILRVFL
jgi:hypothetical protein